MERTPLVRPQDDLVVHVGHVHAESHVVAVCVCIRVCMVDGSCCWYRGIGIAIACKRVYRSGGYVFVAFVWGGLHGWGEERRGSLIVHTSVTFPQRVTS